jgi:hypothetical protein
MKATLNLPRNPWSFLLLIPGAELLQVGAVAVIVVAEDAMTFEQELSVAIRIMTGVPFAKPSPVPATV